MCSKMYSNSQTGYYPVVLPVWRTIWKNIREQKVQDQRKEEMVPTPLLTWFKLFFIKSLLFLSQGINMWNQS